MRAELVKPGPETFERAMTITVPCYSFIMFMKTQQLNTSAWPWVPLQVGRLIYFPVWTFSHFLSQWHIFVCPLPSLFVIYTLYIKRLIWFGHRLLYCMSMCICVYINVKYSQLWVEMVFMHKQNVRRYKRWLQVRRPAFVCPAVGRSSVLWSHCRPLTTKAPAQRCNMTFGTFERGLG